MPNGSELAARMGRACGVLLLAVLGACSRAESITGVENAWRDPGFRVTEGVTTEAELLAALGPPSQLINLGDQRVHYYIRESFRSDRLLLILYNTTHRRTAYDRAVFFFDGNGILTKAALSETALPRE